MPYLSSLEAVLEVLERLTPVKRGLFEDYVANFWCVSSLAIKWRRLFSQQVEAFFEKLPETFTRSAWLCLPDPIYLLFKLFFVPCTGKHIASYI